MGEAQSCPVLHGGKDLFIILDLGGIGNEQNDHIGLTNNRIHLAKGSAVFRKTGFTGGSHGATSLPQTDFDPDIGSLKRIAEILSLGRALRAPADHANLLDTGKGLRKQAKFIPPTADNSLFCPGQFNDFRIKNT